MSDSLWSHDLQHARLPCPSLSPRVCSNSCPNSQYIEYIYMFNFSQCGQSCITKWAFVGSPWLLCPCIVWITVLHVSVSIYMNCFMLYISFCFLRFSSLRIMNLRLMHAACEHHVCDFSLYTTTRWIVTLFLTTEEKCCLKTKFLKTVTIWFRGKRRT